MTRFELRRSIPTIAIAGALIAFSATSGATAALIVTGKQIKDNTVTTKDVKNSSLTLQDLSASTIKTLQGASSPALAGYEIVTASVVVAPDDGAEVSATCPAGKRVLSAMGYFDSSFDGTQSEISAEGQGWAYGYNTDTEAADVLNVDIVCAKVY